MLLTGAAFGQPTILWLTEDCLQQLQLAPSDSLAQLPDFGVRCVTEGLAPVINQKLAEVLMMLKARGMTIVLVEQNFRFAAPLADRHYLMEHGTILEEISAAELPARHEYLHKVLGV